MYTQLVIDFFKKVLETIKAWILLAWKTVSSAEFWIVPPKETYNTPALVVADGGIEPETGELYINSKTNTPHINPDTGEMYSELPETIKESTNFSKTEIETAREKSKTWSTEQD
tara:strand:+ start:1345 stop:1686 length:342 start_codon:yes stop_codon:yes gene_type:complete